MSSTPSQQPLRIKIEREIGRGAHSRVKLGRDLDTFEPLAIKIIELNESGREVFKTELSLLHLIPEHRCVPKLYGHYSTSSKGCLVLEYLPFPTLKEYLSAGPMTEDNAIIVLRQLMDVLHYMTGRGVAHRDLKCDNIIINPDTLALKLIDWGLGTEISGEDARDSTYRGTPVYMAPEVLRELPNYRVVPSELWSLGVIFWECLTGTQPFEGARSKRDLQARQLKAFESIMVSVPEKSQEILRGLLAVNPRERFSIAQLRDKLDELFPAPAPKLGRSSNDRLYAKSRAKTFTDLRDFSNLLKTSGSGSSAGQTPRCPLATPPGSSRGNSPSRIR